ncbi:hypothetical protein FIU97_17045 [Roseivivax sp. THAF40]|uniref:DUF3576 domain-containing protein n=1 Tax=unclassified Roseivivax TaxID=2639302 RepID=UPI001268E399|nr:MULTISPECIES: DUF3576 domain-containing protein [unclassified Roseivivax]QFS84465.1 hypothetical protein FIV09_16630 [Roseivivax sp. THAF197b]QFT48293.1 hypothetical protein FIU97_17045 [Roseivivax sp. THAF40]
MPAKRIAKAFGLISLAALVAGCGMFQRDADAPPIETRPAQEILDQEIYGDEGPPSSTIWDFFRGSRDSEDVGAVNRYIWNASLETLSFLPLDSVDPFTGVISTGYGTPPGGGRAYRATVYVSDPALDARSLNVALMTRSGPASAATVLAVEDAILTRARQLRQRDSRF